MEILIDYLTITWKSDKLDFIREYFKLPKELEKDGYGTVNYRHGKYYPGVNIRWNEMTSEIPWDKSVVYETCLELSGKGCRFVESCNRDFSWLDFFQIVHFDLLSGHCHVARIDIACDVKNDRKITAQLVYKYAKAGLYICKASSLPHTTNQRECFSYFGSSKSDRRLRVYDKALEQGIPDTKWCRFELQLRNDSAFSAVMRLLADGDIGTAFYDEINTFIRFIEPVDNFKNKLKNDHGNRINNADWWNKFIKGAKAVRKISLPKPEYTLERLDRYLYTQPTSSLKAYIEAHDGDITKLIEAIETAEYNKKQQDLLDELRLIKAQQEFPNVPE